MTDPKMQDSNDEQGDELNENSSLREPLSEDGAASSVVEAAPQQTSPFVKPLHFIQLDVSDDLDVGDAE